MSQRDCRHQVAFARNGAGKKIGHGGRFAKSSAQRCAWVGASPDNAGLPATRFQAPYLPDFHACLWTSNWISTARDVQKPAFCQTAWIYPRIFLPQYNLFTGAFSMAKRLILWVK